LQDERDACSLSTKTLAREANDIALVTVLSVVSPQDWAPDEPPQRGTMQFIQLLKNVRSHTTLDKAAFYASPGSVPRVNSHSGAPLIAGNRYFFLYSQRRPDEPGQEVEILPCHAIPDTSEDAKAVQEGIAQDPSNGEPYEFWDQDYQQP
jgi:hypothetical protein